MKEILLYTPIYNFTAAQFIREMEYAKGKDVSLRMNCPGGDVFAAMGMFAKFQEHTGGKKIKVDGMAASGGAYFLLFADYVESLDASKFLFHRAAMGSIEDEKAMDENDKAIVDGANAKLRQALENKVGNDRFKRVTGKSLDDVFSMDNRLDVWLTAAQAKEMGIVNKINPLTTQYKAEVMALSQQYKVAAFADEIPNELKTKIMTLQDVKANSEVFNQLKAEILAAENERVNGWLQFNDTDPITVKTGIESGKEIKMTEVTAFLKKQMATAGLEAIKANTPAPVATPTATTQTPEDTLKEEELKAIRKAAGLPEAGIDTTKYVYTQIGKNA